MKNSNRLLSNISRLKELLTTKRTWFLKVKSTSFSAVSALFRYWGRRATRAFFDWKHRIISEREFKEYKVRHSQKRKNKPKSGKFSENLETESELMNSSKIENLRFLHKH